MFKQHYPGATAALKSAYFSVLDEKAPGWTSTITFVYVMNCYQLLLLVKKVITNNNFCCYYTGKFSCLFTNEFTGAVCALFFRHQ